MKTPNISHIAPNLGLVTKDNSNARLPGTNIIATSGWYVGVGLIACIATSHMKIVGPMTFGVMTVALIYQTNMLLSKKG